MTTIEPGTKLYCVTENSDMELYVEELTVIEYTSDTYLTTRGDGTKQIVLPEDIGNYVHLDRQSAIDQLVSILDEYRMIQPEKYYRKYAAWAVYNGIIS